MEVLGIVLPLMVVIALAGGAIYAFTRGAGSGLTFNTIVSAYAALMIAISLLVVGSGAASLIKAGLSEVGDRDFSYYVPPNAPKPAPEPTRDPSGRPIPPPYPVDYSDRELREDIADGITFTILGTFVLALHWGIGRAVRERTEPEHQRTIDRALALGMTLVSTVGLLISGGTGLSELLRRTVLKTDLQAFESPPTPGDNLGWAIVFLVLWLWFGRAVLRAFRSERDRPAAEEA